VVTGKLPAPDPASREFTDNPTLQAPVRNAGFTVKWISTAFVNPSRLPVTCAAAPGGRLGDNFSGDSSCH
jgi:hypothetical protein